MNKNTRNLLIIFAVLLVIVYFFFRGKDKVTTQDVDEKFFTVDSSKIEKIEIVKTGESVTLEKVNGVWMLTKPVNYPADTTQVIPLLSNLQNYTVERLISSNPANYNTYLDSVNNAKVSVWQEGKMAGSFVLGKTKGTDVSYLQQENGQPVFEASKLVSANFTKSYQEFRNKLVLSIPQFSVNSVTLRSDDSLKYEFTMTKDSAGRWFIGNDSVPSQNSTGFLNYLANFQTESFIDSTINQFPPLTFQIQVKGVNNVDINFYKVKGDSPYYIVQISGNPQLFKMTPAFAGMVIKQKKDFIPETTPKQP